MEKDKEKTKVIFRKYNNGEIIALFPELNYPENTSNPKFVMSYEHIGQHSEADFKAVMKETVSAKPSEYQDLAEELKSIGYDLEMVEDKFEFPKTLPWGHLNQKGEYTLINFIVYDKGVYAFYEKDVGFGFKHAIEISSVNIPDNPNTWDKPLIQVKTLSGNTFGKGTYLIVRTDYYHDIQEAIDALTGKTRIYPPKRKPEPIREMTEQEIKEYWGLK